MDVSEPAQQRLDRIDQQVEEAHRRAARAQELARQAELVRGHANSPRDELTVTVDSLGRLEGLTLTSRALDLGTEGLAAAIVEAAATARRNAGGQVIDMASDLWGADSATVATLRETYLPGTEPEPTDQEGPSPFGFGR